jgi:hypothetical protein
MMKFLTSDTLNIDRYLDTVTEMVYMVSDFDQLWPRIPVNSHQNIGTFFLKKENIWTC